MKHIAFPTERDANAFQQDLVSQGLANPQYGRVSLNAAAAESNTHVVEGGTPEDAGAGAIKGTEAGLAVGAAAGVLSVLGVLGAGAATLATGGLALPVILGMAALGSGVGAAVGAVGGAAGVDETHDGTAASSAVHAHTVDPVSYTAVQDRMQKGEYVIAVDDSVAIADLQAMAAAHHGHVI